VARSVTSSDVAEYLKLRGLALPDKLAKIYDGDLQERLGDLLYRPAGGGEQTSSTFEWAESEIEHSEWPLLPNLLPLLPVDERSFACVVLSYLDEDPDLPAWDGEGAVVRWHVNAPKKDQQAALLDTDCYAYADSVAAELAAREAGLNRMLDVIGPAYQEAYLANERRPRDFIVRPVRVACQNVIVGLAAIAQDSSFDGLSVVAWQTCEVPHVAAHEANRALTALTLCDAFQNGGTMEIRFDRKTRVKYQSQDHWFDGHPEGGVPASLRRYGRTVGVELGADDPKSISPAEARDLFLAITPMPGDLRERVGQAIERYGVSPERLCFTLLAPVWRDIELDYLLATTSRVVAILEGGSGWEARSARQAETEVCRAAVMAGMLHRRLNATDAAGAEEEARVVEDRRAGVEWRVLDDVGAVQLSGLSPGGVLPWAPGRQIDRSELAVFPRSFVTDGVVEDVMNAAGGVPRALVVPRDTTLPALPPDLLVLTCPDRRPDIEKTIEGKLLTARISRG
jgi:hypothetical protein